MSNVECRMSNVECRNDVASLLYYVTKANCSNVFALFVGCAESMIFLFIVV